MMRPSLFIIALLAIEAFAASLPIGGAWFFAAACVGAIICAAHSPRDGRWEAVSLASLLLVNWGMWALAYTDYSPSWNLGKVGVEVSSVHLWMIADAIGGCAAVAIAHRFWWGWALWAVAMVQIGFHAGMDLNLYPPAFYSDVLLNFALLVQLAIFFVMGGADAWRTWVDMLRHIGRVRLFRRSPRPSPAQRSRR